MNTEASAQKRLTVGELQAILADCDPDATVDLSLPSFYEASDEEIVNEPDLMSYGGNFVPEVNVGYLTSIEFPYETYFNENGTVRPGMKPNSVTITLSGSSIESMYERRKRAIETDDEDAGLEPEPVTADANTVVVDVRLSRELHTNIRRLLRDLNASHQVKVEQACTHGLLTVAGALEMLAQDLGYVETRPGSWEGSNLAQVLASHGYTS